MRYSKKIRLYKNLYELIKAFLGASFRAFVCAIIMQDSIHPIIISKENVSEKLLELFASTESFTLSVDSHSTVQATWRAFEIILLEQTNTFILFLALNSQQKRRLNQELDHLSLLTHSNFKGKFLVLSLSDLESMKLEWKSEYEQKMPCCSRIVVFLQARDAFTPTFALFQILSDEIRSKFNSPVSILGSNQILQDSHFFANFTPYVPESEQNDLDIHTFYSNDELTGLKRISEDIKSKTSIVLTQDLTLSEKLAQATHKTGGQVALLFGLDNKGAHANKALESATSFHTDETYGTVLLGKTVDIVVCTNPQPQQDIIYQSKHLLNENGKLLFVADSAEALFSSVCAIDSAYEKIKIEAQSQWLTLCFATLSAIMRAVPTQEIYEKIPASPSMAAHSKEDIDLLIAHLISDAWIAPVEQVYRPCPKLYQHFRILGSLPNAVSLFETGYYLCASPNGFNLHFLSQEFVELPSSQNYRLQNECHQRIVVKHQDRCLVSKTNECPRNDSSLLYNPIIFKRKEALRISTLLQSSLDDKKYRFSRSAKALIFQLRQSFSDLCAHLPHCLEFSNDAFQLWTFAGSQINATLAIAISELFPNALVISGNFSILCKSTDLDSSQLKNLVQNLREKLLDPETSKIIVKKIHASTSRRFFFPLLPPQVREAMQRQCIEDALKLLQEIGPDLPILQFSNLHFFDTPPRLDFNKNKAEEKKEIKPYTINSTPEQYVFKGLKGLGIDDFIAPPHQMLTHNPWAYIDNNADFSQVINLLLKEKYVALDVETTLYNQNLCLVQVAIPKQTFIIDPLAINIHALAQVLENPTIVKIIHNATFEKSVMKKLGIEIHNIADTLSLSRKRHGMKAAGGHKLSEVCLREFGKTMDKSCQTSNWKKRPLTAAQLEYAALDAEILIHLYEKFTHSPKKYSKHQE